MPARPRAPARRRAARGSDAGSAHAASSPRPIALPTPSTNARPDQLGQRTGDQVADRHQRERAHPVPGAHARQHVRRDVVGQCRLPETPRTRRSSSPRRRSPTAARATGAPRATRPVAIGQLEQQRGQPGAQRARRVPASAGHGPDDRTRAGRRPRAPRDPGAAVDVARDSSARARTTARTRTATTRLNAAIVAHTQARERTSRHPCQVLDHRPGRLGLLAPRARAHAQQQHGTHCERCRVERERLAGADAEHEERSPGRGRAGTRRCRTSGSVRARLWISSLGDGLWDQARGGW